MCIISFQCYLTGRIKFLVPTLFSWTKLSFFRDFYTVLSPNAFPYMGFDTSSREKNKCVISLEICFVLTATRGDEDQPVNLKLNEIGQHTRIIWWFLGKASNVFGHFNANGEWLVYDRPWHKTAFVMVLLYWRKIRSAILLQPNLAKNRVKYIWNRKRVLVIKHISILKSGFIKKRNH